MPDTLSLRHIHGESHIKNEYKFVVEAIELYIQIFREPPYEEDFAFEDVHKEFTEYILNGCFLLALINNKVVGGMSSGEIFGELSLILGEERKATVRAVTGSELVEIDSSFLKEYFLSSQDSSNKLNESVLETQRIIKDLSVELGKQKDQSINITKEQLIEAVKDESHVIQSLAIQLHKRLSQMIMKEKKSQL